MEKDRKKGRWCIATGRGCREEAYHNDMRTKWGPPQTDATLRTKESTERSTYERVPTILFSVLR